MKPLTSKQIAALEQLVDGKSIVAPWNSREMTELQAHGFAKSETAYTPAGRLHTSKIWAVTPNGIVFIERERRGL